jgi:hypothetical protein
VLGGATALLGVDQLDAVVLLEHTHVVRDEVEALVELLGEQVRAGDALVENDQNLYTQGMGERFGDDLFDALFLLGFRQNGFLTLFSGGGDRSQDFKDKNSRIPQRFRNFRLFSHFWSFGVD